MVCTCQEFVENMIKVHCVKSIRIRSFFWPVFSCTQFEYRKIRTRKKLRIRRLFALWYFSLKFQWWGVENNFKQKTILKPDIGGIRVVMVKIEIIICFWNFYQPQHQDDSHIPRLFLLQDLIVLESGIVVFTAFEKSEFKTSAFRPPCKVDFLFSKHKLK